MNSWLTGLFGVALLLYVGVILYNYVKEKLTLTMIVLFGTALAADTTATVAVCAMHAQGFSLSLHSISGTLALIIMAIHFAWAIRAYRGSSASREHFHRFSIPAAIVWIVSFLSGIPMSVTGYVIIFMAGMMFIWIYWIAIGQWVHK